MLSHYEFTMQAICLLWWCAVMMCCFQRTLGIRPPPQSFSLVRVKQLWPTLLFNVASQGVCTDMHRKSQKMELGKTEHPMSPVTIGPSDLLCYLCWLELKWRCWSMWVYTVVLHMDTGNPPHVKPIIHLSVMSYTHRCYDAWRPQMPYEVCALLDTL